MFIIICSSSSSVIFSYQIGLCADGIFIVCKVSQEGVERRQRSRLRTELEVCVAEHLRARPREILRSVIEPWFHTRSVYSQRIRFVLVC